MTGSTPIRPGYMVLQGNRMEALRQVVLDWLQREPLGPLEDEVFLVQSNGIAQWLKMSMAAAPADGGWGIAFGDRMMLPARFQWLAYRRVLEAAEDGEPLPETSPFDESRLRWRLMHLLPQCIDEPVFAPLADFLGPDPDLRRRYQLAEQLADLLDQYQVYRADWLEAWSAGEDVIISPLGVERTLPEEQRWQPELWRRLEATQPGARHRAAVHRRFCALAGELDSLPPGLPRRLVVFGISALPQQTLETLAALSGVVQVMLCALNPCRHYWGDLIEDRELLRAEYRRQRRRPGAPADVDPATLHLHAHPLLAAWGKQGRDYLHLLDVHDDTAAYAHLFRERQLAVDLFVEPPTDRLLGQLQHDVLDLRPVAETRQTWPEVDPAVDASVVFHVAHGPQRELEVLHDQLLGAFDADPTLKPRDVIVMVPEVDGFAPHIHAVFGQHDPEDPRHLPYQVADRRARHHEPLLAALEQLLSLPRMRLRASEVIDLLDVPALRARFGIEAADLPLLQRWITGANVRWGLHEDHRRDLGLPPTTGHTWRFGLDRMLAGYAVGAAGSEEADWADVVPYDEVGGLDAAVAGRLYRLLTVLDRYRRELDRRRPPSDWIPLLAGLLEDAFRPVSEEDERLLDRLRTALAAWQDECAAAAFDEPIPLIVVRETWLERLDESRLSQRFLGGAITFATLMPMRAIPFRRVCLLGMSDGAYPRLTTAPDFDLMGVRGQYRPGDRSRREDDRYLFLEALLSAREQLYVSWSGRSPRDNAEIPPSVLVGQLRDHVAAGWRLAGADGEALLEALTTEHPLQPFSAAYFTTPLAESEEAHPGCDPAAARRYTYAREWEALHRAEPRPAGGASEASLPPWAPEGALSLQLLGDFLRHPLDEFHRRRLEVRFRDEDAALPDDEPFALAPGLDRWLARDELVQTLGRRLVADPGIDAEAELERLRRRGVRAGDYPEGPFGELVSAELAAEIGDALDRFRTALQRRPEPVAPTPTVTLEHEVTLATAGEAHPTRHHLTLVDDIDLVRRDEAGALARLVLVTSSLYEKNKQRRWHLVVRHWPAHLALQLIRPHSETVLVGERDDLVLPGLTSSAAEALLRDLVSAWLEAMQQPWPTFARLGFALLDRPEIGEAPELAVEHEPLVELFRQEHERGGALARSFTDLGALARHPDFTASARRLYAPLRELLSSAGAA